MRKNRALSESFIIGMILLSIILTATAAAPQTRDPLPMPAVSGYKILKCDFHMHTVISDGEVWPTTRVMEAWRDGLDAISITDHSDYNPHKEDIKIDLARPYQLARPMADGLGMILIPGIEIAEDNTHFNALFVSDPGSLRGMKLIETLQHARAQDAFVFWNHPGWKQTPEWFPEVAEAYDKKLFHGMELVNGDDFYPEAYPWIDGKQLTILADSDGHAPMPPPMPGKVRTITLVSARTADAAGVREALFARRTAAWMGGEVWGAEPLLKALWDGALKLETPELNLSPGGARAAVRLRNDSALPFRLRLRKAPAWFRGLAGEKHIPAQSILADAVSVAKNTPSGTQRIEIELETTNFHTGPGKNLIVKLPITVNIRP